MSAKILMLIALVGVTTALVAQPGEKGKKELRPAEGKEVRMKERKDMAQGLNLTDVQKESFKKTTIAVQKQLQPLRNELGEAEAHQRTLVTADKPDLAAISKNIEKIGALRVEMAKIQTKHQVEMRAQLTDEQRLKFDLRHEKMKQKRGSKGMRPGRM
jgi:Spy/CpxP family protein refolding chaperone